MVSKQAQEASVFPHGMMNIAMIIAPTFISNQGINQCTALSKLPSLSISIRPAFVG